MAEPDATIRDTPNAPNTPETPDSNPPTEREDGALTLKDAAPTAWLGAPHPGEPGVLSVPGAPGAARAFRGWPVLEQLPTKGAEADIYLVSTADDPRIGRDISVLKLYRHRLEPKLEILNRITGISRDNRHCFVTFHETGFDEVTGRWYELQEYIPLGSLLDVPPSVRRRTPFIRGLISELATAIHCLHTNGIVHCDIKPANVLVRSLEPLDLVLTDFGISSLLASDMSQKMTGLKGTPMYWAPEAFSRTIGRPCDWWGLGVITLELLAGEHPLEGLSDSQIIRKLTLGNIEIPGSLDADWALLLKGLLTKDDSRRWGIAEVSRWLSGKRDIPLFYEDKQAIRDEQPDADPGGGKKPFRFEGVDYYSARDLAMAWASNERPWAAPRDYLRYARQWMESNLDFDAAQELGTVIADADPETALFRFVHSNAPLPFSLMGHIIDADNLYIFLARVIRREASEAERGIAGMMENGRLAEFYSEYAAISGKGDEALRRVISFMEGREPADQWGYFEAMREPGSYVWPDGAELGTAEARLDVMSALGIVPMRRDELDSLTGRYILPRAFLTRLRSTSSYAATVRLMESLRANDQIIPSDSGEDPSAYEDMSVDQYIRAMRLRYMGHTPAIVEKLNAVIDGLRAVTPPTSYDQSKSYFNAIDIATDMREQRITHAELRLLLDISELLAFRRRSDRGRVARFLGCMAGGAAALFSAGLIIGWDNFVFWSLAIILLTIVMGACWFFVPDSKCADRHAQLSALDINSPAHRIMIVFVAVLYIQLRRWVLPFPAFIAVIGAICGSMAAAVLDKIALDRNMTEILGRFDRYAASKNRTG